MILLYSSSTQIVARPNWNSENFLKVHWFCGIDNIGRFGQAPDTIGPCRRSGLFRISQESDLQRKCQVPGEISNQPLLISQLCHLFENRTLGQFWAKIAIFFQLCISKLSMAHVHRPTSYQELRLKSTFRRVWPFQTNSDTFNSKNISSTSYLFPCFALRVHTARTLIYAAEQ